MDTKGRDYKQLRQGEWYSVLAHVFIHDEVMFRPEGAGSRIRLRRENYIIVSHALQLFRLYSFLDFRVYAQFWR